VRPQPNSSGYIAVLSGSGIIDRSLDTPTPHGLDPRDFCTEAACHMATKVKAKARRKSNVWVENIKTIVYAGLIAVVVRTVAYEPFNIPSGSMIPTLLVGDYLFVAKYSYGYSHFSLPFGWPPFSGRIFGSLPKRGDVAVFKYPRDNTTDYIKRIIGLPGDHIQMKEGVLYINGQICPRQSEGNYDFTDDSGIRMSVQRYQETLPDGVKHDVLKETDDGPVNNTPEYVVPPDHVFAMGDNRDNSADSRFMNGVGFVPVDNLVGRAEIIFFSVDADEPWWEFWYWPFEIRWSRLGKLIH
jgi:signal peptidase I